MKTKIYTLFILFIFCSTSLFAKNISAEKAKLVATNFYYNFVQDFEKVAYKSIDLKSVNYKDDYFYVFNVGDKKGYIVISKDDIAKPVLAYAFEGEFVINPHFEIFLDGYQAQIDYARKENLEANAEIQSEWQKYSTQVSSTKDEVETIIPLVLSKWNQGYPWNALCPETTMSYDGHVPSGCVATAFSMVMKYYNYPEQGIGFKTYEDDGDPEDGDFGTQSANFGGTTYDWDNMPHVIDEYNTELLPEATVEALATLAYHCGVSLTMNYGIEGSGTQTYYIASQDIAEEHFGYSSDVNSVDKYNYSASTWENIAKNQLTANQPIIYSGHSSDGGGGHAWVCDGMQEEDNELYFHMNFGWGGSGDGFCTLDDVVTHATGGGTQSAFDMGHEMIIDLYPDDDAYPYHCQDDVNLITGVHGSFDDGSVQEDYLPNQNCTYSFQPSCNPIYTYTEVSFEKYALNAGETLTFYDGSTTESAVLEIFDFDENVPVLTSENDNTTIASISGNGLSITFNSDSEFEGNGFDLLYNTKFCKEHTFNQKNFNINDGSGACQYNNQNQKCYYTIEPEDATEFTLKFTEYDLAQSNADYVFIYANSTTTNPVEVYMYGVESPTLNEVKTYSANKIIIEFNGTIGEGWTLDYTSNGIVNIEKIEAINNLEVHPNPVNSTLFVNFETQEKQDVKLSLRNILGQTIYTKTIEQTSGKYEEIIDVSNFTEGVYFLETRTNKANQLRKIIVK